MVNGAFGSEAKPTSPEWFQYIASDISDNLPPLSNYVAAKALGLSEMPVNVHDFCMVPPPTDFPTLSDIASISDPVTSYISGAYRRFGNVVKAKKWEELCQWKAPPLPVVAHDPPNGYQRYYQDEAVSWTNTDNTRIQWAGDQLPITAIGFAIRIESYDGDLPYLHFFLVDFQPHTGDSRFASGGDYIVYNGGLTGTPPAGWHTFAMPPTRIGQPCWPVFYDYDPSGVTRHLVFDWAWMPPTPDDFTAPDPVDTPPGFPTGGGPCETPTMADLCKAIAAVQNTADAILNSLNPPVVVVDPDADPVEPVDGPPPEDGSKPDAKPVVKPKAAIGAVVRVTSFPDYTPHYGTAPEYYPTLGHVAQLTKVGPMPSVEIKHIPMVIQPLQATVESLQISLRDGVTCEVNWIYPPEAAPPAAT
jgi:hypothetical protein